MEYSTLTLWTGPFPIEGVSGQLLLVSCFFVEILELNANSVDPDQMWYSMVSDLGLHYLPMSLL